MSKETGGPAFPFKSHIEGAYGQSDGMTLRDYFAAKAMQGLLASPRPPLPEGADVTDVLISKLAYKTADAMLRARGE